MNQGYDENRRILGRDGKYIDNTDIIQLIQHAMSPGKILFGENEFLDLLQRSRVPTEFILNENVRHRMMSINRQHQEIFKEPEIVVMKDSPPHEIEVEPSEYENQYEEYEREKQIEETLKQSLKRKLTDDDYNFES